MIQNLYFTSSFILPPFACDVLYINWAFDGEANALNISFYYRRESTRESREGKSGKNCKPFYPRCSFSYFSPPCFCLGEPTMCTGFDALSHPDKWVFSSLRPSVRFSVRLSVCPSLRPSVCLSIRPSVPPSFRPSLHPPVFIHFNILLLS